MPKRKEKALQIIDQSLPMTGKATRDGKHWIIKWANGTKQKLLVSVVKQKDGILWIESAKKAELSGQIREVEAAIAKVRRDLKRNPKDTVKKLTILGWRRYLSTLKKALSKIDKQKKLHDFVEARICQKV